MIDSDTARMLPVSAAAQSVTLNVQSPSVEASSSGASGWIGRHVPVNGSSRGEHDRERARRGVVEDDLAEVLARAAVAGESLHLRARRRLSMPVRSPTKEWSMPTVVEAGSSLQAVPSTANVIFDA